MITAGKSSYSVCCMLDFFSSEPSIHTMRLSNLGAVCSNGSSMFEHMTTRFPCEVLGHSVGEYAAAVVAGVTWCYGDWRR